MKYSWGLALWEARKATSDGAASVAEEVLGLKGSWGKLRLWHHVASQSPWREVRRGYGWRCSRDPRSLETPAPGDDHQRQRWGGAILNLEYKLCAVKGKAQERELPNLSVALNIRSPPVSNTVALWFCFNLFVPVPWFFPLKIRKYITYVLFYRKTELIDLGI